MLVSNTISFTHRQKDGQIHRVTYMEVARPPKDGRSGCLEDQRIFATLILASSNKANGNQSSKIIHKLINQRHLDPRYPHR